MALKIYLASILLFFILAFAVKNIKTYLATKGSIKGKSKKLSASIILSTLIYILIALRLIFSQSNWMFEIDLNAYRSVNILALIFVSIGFIMGVLSLITMKNSWRVGIKYDQKTDLVTKGIYSLSRNPYFFSYDLLILGYILFFPSPLLLLLYLPLVVVFHFMILEEEKYLESVHGQEYLNYKKRVGRYIG